MMKFIQGLSKKAGLPPGTPVHVGEQLTDEVDISVLDYDANTLDSIAVQDIEQCFPYKDTPSVSWININGLHDVSVIQNLGTDFHLHPLTIEDILNTTKRPKLEVFDNYILVILKMHFYDVQTLQIDEEQISIIFGRNYVLTFQEKAGDVLESVRFRLKNNKGRIRRAGADYLAYALMDTVVDNYFTVLEGIGETIEALQDEVLTMPTPGTLQKVHIMKREALLLRKSIWPLREIINLLQREESSLIDKSTEIYLRDLYDHTIQVIDTIETFRDMISGLLDIYLSSVSNRMNEIMKILTIFAAIFIPLTFIAGIYGMNFNTGKSAFNMPELDWTYGYPFALGLMAVIGAGMAIYFKKNKWF